MVAVQDHIQARLDTGDGFNKSFWDNFIIILFFILSLGLPSGKEFLSISSKDVLTLYKLCVDETAQALKPSYWCELISPLHLATLHRYSNVKAFWKKGSVTIYSNYLGKSLMNLIIRWRSCYHSTKEHPPHRRHRSVFQWQYQYKGGIQASHWKTDILMALDIIDMTDIIDLVTQRLFCQCWHS